MEGGGGGEERRGSTHSDGKCTMMQERKWSHKQDALLQKALAQTSVF